jgi:hypothetical protein
VLPFPAADEAWSNGKVAKMIHSDYPPAQSMGTRARSIRKLTPCDNAGIHSSTAPRAAL